MKRWIFLASGLLGPTVWAAACCGTSSAVPALLSGPDQSQVSLGFSYGTVVADADPSGTQTPRGPTDAETAQNILVTGATLLSDRWQTGLSFPINRRTRSRNASSAQHTGIGDVSAHIAFEALPEWTYSTWRPKGVLFSTLTLPTGGSLYDSSQLYSVDSHGKGFVRWGVGALLTKQWGAWDLSLVGEVHRSFGRTLAQSETVLSPGWGASGQLAAGVAPWGGQLRLGLSTGPQWEDGVEVLGPAAMVPVGEQVWTTTVEANWFFNMEWTATLSYSDQSWLGEPQNTGVRRVATFRLIKRWPR